jgi:hypothetical protein
MVNVKLLHPRATSEHIGMIPYWLDENNPLPAAEQLDANYGHGGGWRPFKGFTLRKDYSIDYPGDPPLRPIAEMHLRDELILMYEQGWVAVIQPDRSFEIARMD